MKKLLLSLMIIAPLSIQAQPVPVYPLDSHEAVVANQDLQVPVFTHPSLAHTSWCYHMPPAESSPQIPSRLPVAARPESQVGASRPTSVVHYLAALIAFLKS